jgi:glycerol-3-phosphate acyltransferase PlsY
MIEAWVVGLAAGYLLGSIPVGLWIGRSVHGVDLRAGGSGKIGATNAYRRLGLKWSLLVFLLDVSKGIVPVVIVRAAFDSPTGDVLAGMAAIVGHVYPVYAGFHGGRAAATGFGALLILTPMIGAVAILVCIAILAITRIMSLAVILGITVSGASQGLLVAFGGEPDAYYGFAVGAWLVVLFAHRDNLRRLAAGQERVLGRSSAGAGS